MTLNPFSANFTKWSNTLKLFVGKLTANCLIVFGHFVGFALKGLINILATCHVVYLTCYLLFQYCFYCLCYYIVSVINLLLLLFLQTQSCNCYLNMTCSFCVCVYIIDSVGCYVISSVVLNTFMMEAVIIQKPIQWFAEQINGLVSI